MQRDVLNPVEGNGRRGFLLHQIQFTHNRKNSSLITRMRLEYSEVAHP